MAFLSRIGKSKLTQTSHKFKSVSHGSLLLNQAISRAKPYLLAQNPHQPIPNNHAEFFHGVRFFAAPIQFLKPKKEPTMVRINEEITAEYVRLVIDNEHSVVPRSQALLRAKQLKLDLVQVSNKGDPPVCKLMDYKKEKFEKETKEKELSKTKGEKSLRPGAPKEIRFSGKTEKKDLEVKASKITKLIEDGYKVKCIAKGAEKDVLLTLSRLCNLLGDVTIVDTGPLLAAGSASVTVKHIKFGQKSGKIKKIEDITDEKYGLLVASPVDDEESDSAINEESSAGKVDEGKAKVICSKPQTVPSSEAGTSSGDQNRYSGRDGLKNQSSSAKGVNVNNRNSSARDRQPVSSESKFSNQGRQKIRETRPPHQMREERDATSGALGKQGVEAAPGEVRDQNRYASRRPLAAGGSRPGGFGSFSR